MCPYLCEGDITQDSCQPNWPHKSSLHYNSREGNGSICGTHRNTQVKLTFALQSWTGVS